MKKSLYEIGQEYEAIAEQLETGELTPELETALSITQDELQTKAINYGFVIKQFDDEVSNIDNEIKRLQALKKSKESAKQRIKDNVSDAMLRYGIKKVEIPTLKLSFLPSQSTEIIDQKLIPNIYKQKVTTIKIDKNAIKNDLKNGVKVPGAKLLDKDNLQIK